MVGSLHESPPFLQDPLHLPFSLVLTSSRLSILVPRSSKRCCTYSLSTKTWFIGKSQYVDSCWYTSIRNPFSSTPAWSHSQFHQSAYYCTHPHRRQWGVPRVDACCREHKNLLQGTSSPITRLGRLLVACLFKGVSS